MDIENCTFIGNKAVNLVDNQQEKIPTAGRGGCLSLICDIEKAIRCPLTLKQSKFLGNFAEDYEPNIFSLDVVAISESQFTNNTDKTNFSNDSFSSAPYCISLIDERNNQIPRTCNLDQSFLEFTSGQVFNASLAILDSQGHLMRSVDKSSVSELSSSKENVDPVN